MKLTFSEGVSHHKNRILFILKYFKNKGILIGDGNRNIIKYFYVSGMILNFKSFKQHNFINRHVYKYYRKSKAKRSFEYSQLLISKNFLTPKPIAYVENHDFWGLTSSFYISEHLENTITLTAVISDKSFEDRENILRHYTALIFNLHNFGIQFIDNSSGNFLLEKSNNSYNIYMVDLNRMNFHEDITLYKRLKNFARFTNDPEIVKIIAREYALLSGESEEYCYKTIIKNAKRMHIKRKIKKVLKLYKYIIRI